MSIRLCAFADEYGRSLDKQINGLKKNEIDLLEIRTIDGINVENLSTDNAIEIAKRLKQESIEVWSISTSIGKQYYNFDKNQLKQICEHCIQIAKIFGTKNVRIFSFYVDNPQDVMQKQMAMERIALVVDIFTNACLVPCIENEKGILGESPLSCMEILNRFNGKLRFVFDTQNFEAVGFHALDSFKMLKDKIFYFHIKDYRIKEKAICTAGTGDCEIEQIMTILRGRDYVMTVEPHLTVINRRNFYKYLLKRSTEIYKTKEEAFNDAVSSLKNILKKNGMICIHNY